LFHAALRLLEITRVLVRFIRVARFHRKRDDLNAAAQQKEKKQSASFSPALVMKQFSIYELSSHEAARHDF